MATYTILTREDVERILDSYDLGLVLDLESLGGGQANSSFIITSQTGRYVLSVCDEKSPTEVSILTATLDHLNRHNYRTSGLIKTGDGKHFIDFDNKPVYAKDYMEGSVKDTLSPDMAYQVGAALAELHAIPVFPELPGMFAYGIEIFDTIVDRPGSFPDWLNSRMDQLKACCHPDLPKGLIHGDLFYDNILFDAGNLSAILDFEEACNYYLLFDLGMCAAGSCCVNGTFSLDLVAALTEGYQALRSLSRLEQELLQDHIIYGAAATAFWRYRQYNIIHPDIGKQAAYVEMMEVADQVAAILPETFKNAVLAN